MSSEIEKIMESINAIGFYPTGSRYICDPPPADTDEDWVALVPDDVCSAMQENGFSQDGSPEFYTGNDNVGFRSWRKGEVNIVTTEDSEFFNRFVAATDVAKRLNILKKSDRIALFQVCLYGVAFFNLERSS